MSEPVTQATDPSAVGFRRRLQAAVDDDSLHSATLSQPRTAEDDGAGATTAYEKISVRPVEIRGERQFQFAFRAGKQETHRNLNAAETVPRICELLDTAFSRCRLQTANEVVNARVDAKGRYKVKHSQKRREVTPAAAVHNRAKNYLIPEGVPCRFLEEIGVMTAEGRVHAAKSKKFRQVNRFLELIDDVLSKLPTDRPLQIVDFGCGKSYLTFALDHLVRTIRGCEAQIVGLDREASVIESCNRVARRLECRGLSFQVGDISGYQAPGPVDMVVSLHACDTATDDALAKAVGWNARAILAAPCCQHDLFTTMQSHRVASLARHGVLKERFAALSTDALRAELLELHGYRTQVVEFIDMEHTPKNMLIRAVRREQPAPAAERLSAYRDLKSLLGVETTPLEQRIGETGGS